jgi:hypothetical protein
MTDVVYLEDPDEILDYLDPMIRAFDEALDSGVSEADGFFSVSGHRMNRSLWSHVARYGTCQQLRKIELDGWRWKELPLCGIQMARDPLALRVGRTRDGDVPPPGRSMKKRGYYMQRGPSLGLDFGGVIMPAVSNLLLDWDVNERRERILHLSKPAGVWESWESSVLEWRRVVKVDDAAMRFDGAEETDVLVESVLDMNELQGGEVEE